MSIDWKLISKKMGYPDSRAIITDLYGNQGLPSRPAANKITEESGEYITGGTVLKYAHLYGLEIRPRGGANNISADRGKLLALGDRTRDMTAQEIADEVGVSVTWMYNLMRQMGIKYKPGKRGKRAVY